MSASEGFVLICGGGNLPYLIANHMRINNKNFILLILRNSKWDKRLKFFDKKFVDLGNVITELLNQRKRNFKNIILAGSILRPSIKDIKPDINTLKLIPKLTKVFLQGGDNNLLAFLIKEIEKMNFSVLSVKDIVPNLFNLEDIRTKLKPNKIDLDDIKKGKKILDTLSSFDIGQSIIIQQGNVLGIEAAEGTDNLIKRIKKLVKTGNRPILIKLIKKNQDVRADLPTLGIQTVNLCFKSNIKGIAYSFDKTILIEKQRIIKRMNNFKMFLFGLKNV